MKTEVDIKDLSKRVTVSVTLWNIKQWRVRIWLGKILIRLAAWVMWVNVEFEERPDEDGFKPQ